MRLLVVVHSRSGGTRVLADAVLDGVAMAIEQADADVEAIDLPPGSVDADVVRSVDGIVVATSEHFGGMAGMVKDLFERIYYDIIDDTRGRPYALVVKGAHDGAGTVRGVESIATGLGWKQIAPPLVVIGNVEDRHLEAATELGGSFAAGLPMGIF